MTKMTVVWVEIVLLTGIFLSIFLVPRSLPTLTFAAISVIVFIGANVILFGRRPKTIISPQSYKPGAAAYFALVLFVIYWLLHFLRK